MLQQLPASDQLENLTRLVVLEVHLDLGWFRLCGGWNQIHVLQDVGENTELLHLVENREAAERWLARNGYSRARLEEITADEVGAHAIEGRAAA